MYDAYYGYGYYADGEKPQYDENLKLILPEEEEEEITSLADTYRLMQSDDYKERFLAEYYQTKIRYNKLHRMIIN